MSSECKTIRVKNRLGEMLRRPGGIVRSQAIETAAKAVETLREEYVGSIPGEIDGLEAIAARSKGKLSREDIDDMLGHASRLLTLTGTFGYELLDQVAKRFCDFAGGMLEMDIRDAAPVNVHVRAMRLVCPGAVDLSQEEIDDMLTGLEKVRVHYGIERPQAEAQPSKKQASAG